MRNCRRCGETKPLAEFALDKSGAGSYCRPCNRERVAKYKTVNTARVLNKDRKRYSKDRERILARQRDYYRENKDLNAARVRRRAEAKQRASVITTASQMYVIQDMAELARRMTLETGVVHELDHIVPLQGANVCGLHAPWNIQIITAEANRKKGLSFDPESRAMGDFRPRR